MKVNPETMTVAADHAADLLKSLANRHRLLIVCQLLEKERSVGELTAFLSIRDSTVSQHLAVLRRERIVSARRDGQTIWYSIGSAAARSVVESLYRSFCAPAQVCTPPAKGKSGRQLRNIAARQ
jgi:ArsR family transcriptional regulator, virulence genes transcriptional regulator